MADEGSSASRRILAVALEGETAALTRVVKDLTGTAPSAPSADLSLAGTTHPLKLTTPYYSTTVPIWLDLIADPKEWSSSFLSPEAVEVLAVLGAVVVVFKAGPATGIAAEPTRSLIQHVGKVVKEGLGGWDWEGVGLAVGVGEGDQEEWDEVCAEAGLEFVMVGSKESSGRNEFGEKTGIARVKEALETNDWTEIELPFDESDFGDFETGSAKDDDDEAADDKDLDPRKMGFGFDQADFEGLRRAIWEAGQDQPDDAADTKVEGDEKKKDASGDKVLEDSGLGDLDEDEVAKVEKMMRKLQAVREAGEGMGEEQRKRMAARAVEEVMREL
ncbi:hypothetical protein BGZ61DRAFT_445602 [Ilyonectria robusta]|uniref:uncharacterized protein n=1 Tax=Ilyonectria robusta TaxID=1079257 RepID=UPI001E8E8814|nr:uncharacterized protein BGZ61DRAFT_445602 [Ilyonectria robusta]KAH8733963.1 hypothetical protein BGZ61DRAFT_445602 [Ilyonectria robusta]